MVLDNVHWDESACGHSEKNQHQQEGPRLQVSVDVVSNLKLVDPVTIITVAVDGIVLGGRLCLLI